MVNPPAFLSDPVFWFALVNLIVIFLPRFGIVLTAQEITAINLTVAAAFKVAPPVNGWVASKRYEMAARQSLATKEIPHG